MKPLFGIERDQSNRAVNPLDANRITVNDRMWVETKLADEKIVVLQLGDS